MRFLKTAIIGMLLLTACKEAPETKRARFLSRGKQLVEKGDLPRALIEFRNAAQAKPSEAAEPYYQMGLIYSAEADFRSAYAAFQSALGVDPNHAGAKLKVAQMMAASEDVKHVEEANRDLKALQSAGKVDPEALNTLALTELRLGQVEGAIHTLERALTLAPGEEISHLTLARAKMAQRDVKGTEEVLKKAAATLPKSTLLARVLAGFYADQKRWGDAEAQLLRASAAAPADGGTLLDLARVLVTTGRKSEAETVLRRLSQLESFHGSYAGFLVDENRREDALKELEQQFAKYPSDRAVRTHLVGMYRDLGKKDRAIQVLDRALAVSRADVDAVLQRAEIFLQDKQFDKAEEYVNVALKGRPAAAEVRYISAKLHLARGTLLTYRQDLAEALKLNPALLPVRVELAQLLTNSKEPKAALTILDAAPAAQKAAPAFLVQRNWALWALGDMSGMRKGIDEGLARERSNDFLLQDSMWKLRSNEVAGARTSLEEALKRDPGDIRVIKSLSNTYLRSQNRESALRVARESAAKNPKSAPIQDFLGSLLLQNKDFDAARKAFEAAKSADPTYQQAELSLVQLDVVQNKIQEAQKRLDAVAARDASGPVRLWMGNVAAMKGDYVRAIDEYRRAVAANPSDAEATNNLAYLLAEHSGDTEEALKHAQKAVELAPDDLEYCDTLGWVLYRKGLFKSAIPYLERAATAPTANAVSRYHLSMAYTKAGDRIRGERTFQAALKANPKLPEAEAARKVLSDIN